MGISNASFVINKKYAESFVNNLKKITHTSDAFIHKILCNIDNSIQHFKTCPFPIRQLSSGKSWSNKKGKFYSEIHPKGVDRYDIERKKNHVKRVDNADEYTKLFNKWIR